MCVRMFVYVYVSKRVYVCEFVLVLPALFLEILTDGKGTGIEP